MTMGISWTVRLTFVVILLSSSFLSSSRADVLPYFEDTFDHEVDLLMKEQYKLFLKFYGYNDLNSEQFLPTYLKLDEALEGGEQGIIIGRAEMRKNADLTRRFGIFKTYGPSFVYLVEPGKFYRYRGKETVEAMVEWMKTGYLNEEESYDIPPSKWDLEKAQRLLEEQQEEVKEASKSPTSPPRKSAMRHLEDFFGEPGVIFLEKKRVKQLRWVVLFIGTLLFSIRRFMSQQKRKVTTKRIKSD